MQEPSNYNSQQELRKTIALIAGIILVFAGVFMLYHGISASGTVDFKTTLIKGKIETGSAGLLAILFGFIIIYQANHTPKNNSSVGDRISTIARLLLKCNQLTSILSFVLIILLLPLVYLLEPIRIYLIGLISIIVFLNLRQEQK